MLLKVAKSTYINKTNIACVTMHSYNTAFRITKGQILQKNWSLALYNYTTTNLAIFSNETSKKTVKSIEQADYYCHQGA